jgi:spermidine/putrescine transport system permease protein
MLVFVPAMGEFVIPDLMGGGRTMYLGNLLADQFLKARDWPFGAAICVSAVMLVALGYVTTMTLLRYGHHLQRRRQE